MEVAFKCFLFLILIVLIAFIMLDASKDNQSNTELSFNGMEYWGSLVDNCKEISHGDSTKPDMKCYVVHDKLHFFRVEEIRNEPILLLYHQLVPTVLCDRALEDIRLMEFERAGVVSTDPSNPSLFNPSRVVNSTKVKHRERITFNRLFNTLQRTLLAVDLAKAENFLVMSYNKHGHYAAHYDFFNKDDVSTADELGNRIATVFTILQSAEKGGSTIFPLLNINVKPGKGDVLVWLNMNVEHEREEKSLHAACPIWEGTKIGTTLWVRSFGQEFRLQSTADKKFPIDVFLKPNVKISDSPLFCGQPMVA